MARQSRDPTILLTRPWPQSQRFAAQLLARWPGLKVITSPLMSPEFLQPDLPHRSFAGLILTSEAGAEAARRISATGFTLPAKAYCVGSRTALAASSAGFRAQSAQATADALVSQILANPPPGPLLFLRGADTTGNIADRLNSAKLETVSVVCYTQTPQALSADATGLLQDLAPVIVPLFSPRSARIFGAECARVAAIAPLWVAALSPAVAAATTELAMARMRTAVQPDAAAMLETVATLLADGKGS